MAVQIVTVCAGFLLAVLWMDLIFDTQIRNSEPDESALASVAGYYRRATTTSRPMSALIAIVMGILVVALGIEAATGDRSAGTMAVSAALVGAPTLLALARTVPNAVRLGSRADSPREQARLARAILRDHLVCLLAMTTFVVFWVAAG